MKKRICRLASLLLGGLVAFGAGAQSYSIDWHKIGAGHGSSMGGPYEKAGTIAQHDAGTTRTGGGYSLTGGFWSLISVVQTPGAPMLNIAHTAQGVVISWQQVSDAFTLEENEDAANPEGWRIYAGIIETSNGVSSITLTAPAGKRFFRLVRAGQAHELESAAIATNPTNHYASGALMGQPGLSHRELQP